MKKTLLSLILFSSLMTLTGCLKGCGKDKNQSEQTTESATDKKEEAKEEPKNEKNNAEMDVLETPAIETVNEIQQEEKGINSSAMNDMRPDEFWLEEREDGLRYGEPRRYEEFRRYEEPRSYGEARRYGDAQRYGERGSRFI